MEEGENRTIEAPINEEGCVIVVVPIASSTSQNYHSWLIPNASSSGSGSSIPFQPNLIGSWHPRLGHPSSCLHQKIIKNYGLHT